jgi:hypothetical protein
MRLERTPHWAADREIIAATTAMITGLIIAVFLHTPYDERCGA